MSNSKQVTPEAIEEERELPRPANNNSNNMEQVGVGQPSVGGVGGVARRDENSISFRHFLQPHSDVVPSPAPTCRRNRGTQPGAVDLVDMAMALPDFVQDHLVVESLAIADHQNDGGSQHAGASAVDLNVLNEILPDFTASQPSHALPSQSGHTRRRNMQEESSAAPEVSHGGAGGTSALPDFLSDGPMQCTDTNAVDNSMSMSGPSSSRSASRILNSNSLTERNRIVDESSRSTSFDSSDTMRSEVERLRRELAERNRRISQLEGEVLRLRTNASMLETALRTTEQNLTSSETRRLNVEREVGDKRRLTKENTVGASGDAVPSTSSGVTVNGSVIEDVEMNPHLVRSIATSSEALLSQLLQNMARLKGLSNTASHRSEDQPKKSSEPDEGQQN